MNSIKRLSLAAVAVIAFVMVPGVASASPGFVTADSYPATLVGEATGTRGELSTVVGTSKCTSPNLAGTLTKPTDALTPSAEYVDCDFLPQMNGCEFAFHPLSEGVNGSFDIGGSKCTGITGQQSPGFPIRILPQSGLSATFENEGSGTSSTVRVHAQATGLKYEVLSGPYKGTYSNGAYTTTWSVSGKHAGNPTGVRVSPFPGLSVIGGGSGAEFHSDLYPATIGGEQEAGKLELKMGVGTLKCATATFSSSVWAPEGLLGDTGELPLTPTVGGCTLAGIAATVTPVAGCSYNFALTGGAPYVGTLYVCKVDVAVGGSKCVITMPGQTRAGLEYANVGSGSAAAVETKVNLSGVEYQVTNGKYCPNSPSDGSYSNATYKGTVKLKVTKVN